MKIAIITGAGTGIGRACALSLVKMDYRIYLVGRREEALIETKTQALELANNMLVHACDLTEEKQVEALFQRVEDEQGRLDLLFNNAGMNTDAVPPDALPLKSFKQVMDVNVNAVFHCASKAFAIMKKQNPQGGRIINNGSISAQMPRPFSAPYTASKHAITGLTKALSLDGREFDICVGQIDIGNATTNMTTKMNDGVLQANGDIKAEACMDVQNVADAFCYMASRPLDTNILQLNVMANNMPFVGRG